MKRVLLLLPLLLSCAQTPKGRARQTAVIQKTSVDGVGKAYLGFCEIVRVPKCQAEDAAAKEAGTPQSKEQRVTCLRPCDSATATKIQKGVDVLRTKQTALFLLLKKDGATEEELDASRKQLRRAADELMELLEQSGVMKELGSAVGGLGG